MYPTIVIVLVETQRSMTDIWEISPSNTSRLARPVASDHEAFALTSIYPSFVVGSVNSAMDNEAESLPSCALQNQDLQGRGSEKVILGVKESWVSTRG